MSHLPALPTRPVGRPRKEPAHKKRGKSVALDPVTLSKMDAVRQVHTDGGYYPPTDSWMVEQGLHHYLRTEVQRFPELQAVFDRIEVAHGQSRNLVTPIARVEQRTTKTRQGDTPPKGEAS